MNEPEELRQPDPTHVIARGRKLIFFAGCDYYRLSWRPSVVRAISTGLQKFGLNVAASRLTTGNHPLYARVESALAGFFGVEQATLVSTGYLADLVAAEAMRGRFSHVLLDSAAHPALRHAAEILDVPLMPFASQDSADLARSIKRCGPGAIPIVLTEGMFARNGSVAPLKSYLRLLPPGGMLLVDDAHGAGVVGPTGRGSLEHCGVGRSRVIQTITLSKAFGGFGGAVLGNRRLRKNILERSRMFVGSTPAPLPLLNGILESLRICDRGTAMRQRLRRNAARVKAALRQRGFGIEEYPGPIVALAPSSPAVTRRVRKALLGAGIYPSLIRYPGVPEGGCFRFVISSEHTPQQVDLLASTLSRFSPAELNPR
jgi:8-amino-7-oxononanoate synthase